MIITSYIMQSAHFSQNKYFKFVQSVAGLEALHPEETLGAVYTYRDHADFIDIFGAVPRPLPIHLARVIVNPNQRNSSRHGSARPEWPPLGLSVSSREKRGLARRVVSQHAAALIVICVHFRLGLGMIAPIPCTLRVLAGSWEPAEKRTTARTKLLLSHS